LYYLEVIEKLEGNKELKPLTRELEDERLSLTEK